MISVTTLQQSGRWLAVGYILLALLNFSLFPPLTAQDLLAPVLLGVLLWQWRQSLSIFRESYYALPMFLGLAFIVSLFHASSGTGGFYDFAVFAYMAVLYVSFRLLPLDERLQARLGLALLLLLLAGFGVGILALYCPSWPGQGLFYLDPHSGSRGLDFLAVRYQFLFPNPNLLGSFYALPVALLQPCLRRQCQSCRTPQRWLLVLLVSGILLLPLLSTASKHALLTLAILAGTVVEAWPEKRQLLLFPASAAVLLFAGICLLTVLWPTFPLSRQFPFVNVRHQGNYTIHQEIYLKMLQADKSSWLAGIGATAIRQRYPKFADRDKIASIMEQYHSPHWVQPFSTYMDPHNEYLNLASLFGIPAALCCFAFWLLQKKQGRYALKLFILAVLFCCLWDDLLSKRWLWIALAIMVLNGQQKDTAGA